MVKKLFGPTAAKWVVSLSILLVSLHYIFFVSSINQERACRADAINKLYQLDKDAYENQNRLTVEYATATARTAPARDNGEFNAQVQEVFAAHYARLAVLDKRYAEIGPDKC